MEVASKPEAVLLQQPPSIVQLPTPERKGSHGSQTPSQKNNNSAPLNPFINNSPSKELKMADIIQQ